MMTVVFCRARGFLKSQARSQLRNHGEISRSRQFSSASTVANSLEESDEKQRRTTIRLYRVLQRISKSFTVNGEGGDTILLQPKLKAFDWGQHRVFSLPDGTMNEDIYRLFYVYNDDSDENISFSPASIDDWYYNIVGKTNDQLKPMTTLSCWTSKQQLSQAIKQAFKLTQPDEMVDPQALIMWSIRATQLLQDQRTLWKNSSIATTEGIRVVATSRYIGTSSPASALVPPAVASSMLESKNRFAYRVRIENLSQSCVQLLGRYWHIQDADQNGEIDESKEPVVVDAPVTGAVGHLPVLRPGQVFEYMSGTDLANAKGLMQGHFYMARVPDDTNSAKSGDDVAALKYDEKLEVKVAPFTLEAD